MRGARCKAIRRAISPIRLRGVTGTRQQRRHVGLLREQAKWRRARKQVSAMRRGMRSGAGVTDSTRAPRPVKDLLADACVSRKARADKRAQNREIRQAHRVG